MLQVQPSPIQAPNPERLPDAFGLKKINSKAFFRFN